MFKINYHFVVYRYEAILVFIILLLTGSIAVSSKDPLMSFPPPQACPYSIALTFDDGPHPEYTEKLLKVLADNNVKATFFVVGSQAFKYPDLLKEISAAGHEIENHTMTHENLKKLSVKEIKSQLVLAQNVIKNIAHQDSLHFRPPGGQYDKKVMEVAEELKLEMVLWTVFPKDHERPAPSVIKERVLSQASDGGVIILHSGVDQTIAALPEIIGELKKRGFKFLTINQLEKETRSVQIAWLKK